MLLKCAVAMQRPRDKGITPTAVADEQQQQSLTLLLLLYFCYCCRCDPGSVNANPGGICQPCSVANSAPNAARTACLCADGFNVVLSPASGALLKCTARSLNQCKATAHAVVNIVGNGCTCEAGFDPVPGSNGALLICVAPAPVVRQDSATAVSGTWTIIPVRSMDASNARVVLAVSKPLAGGRAVVLANAAGTNAIR
jgi:hypothetical protein